MLKLPIRNLKIKSFSDVFGKEQKYVFKELDKLHEFLKKLKYEGKLFQRRNMRTVEKIIGDLKGSYSLHKEIDDQIIFPFLGRHIPRLSPFLLLLSGERNEFYNILGDCEGLLAKLKKNKTLKEQADILDQLSDKGIYAIVLIRNHIQTEMESVYSAIDKELHTVEKDQLIASFKKHTLSWKKK
ncbi:MAG: hypothetical protein NUV91_04160 [Candidatus Omnitrophica bacterium]|nr:hypothetical protein [Candidatus Omnitrophota bacterium]